MKQIVSNRWFALTDLFCVLLSCILWYVFPQLGWRPLLIALLPWLLRLTAGHFPFERTRFDFPLSIFLLTAAVGGWAAYDQQTAWAKFWILICGVLFFYALAYQPESNLWLVVSFWCVVGISMSAYFLLTNDWSSQAEKIGILHQIGLKWASIRPALQAPPLHPNSAAGITAIMTPFSLAMGLRARREKKLVLFAGLLIGWGVLLAGLLLSASRGAWLAVCGAAGVWLLWLISNSISRQFTKLPSGIFIYVFVLLVCSLAVIGMFYTRENDIVSLLGTIPGPASVFTRIDLAHSALNLVADFPFTGGGLGSFPGLYSQYILVVPFYYTEFSHNVFLDVAVEQGVVGLLVLIIIFTGSLHLFFSNLTRGNASDQLLNWVIFASFFVMLIHGLVDNVIYGRLGSPLIFVQTGMLVATNKSILQKGYRRQPGENHQIKHNPLSFRSVWKLWGFGFLTIICLVLAINFCRSLLSLWYSNLGAVEMARVELTGFPAGKWEDGSNVAFLNHAERMFKKALLYDPNNHTANHRLGLIASLRRDFPSAVKYLEIAYRESMPNRGIQKVLGYNYTWIGQYDKAVEHLSHIPEARQELNIYAWWWGTQGREDLASSAEFVAARLLGSSSRETISQP